MRSHFGDGFHRAIDPKEVSKFSRELKNFLRNELRVLKRSIRSKWRGKGATVPTKPNDGKKESLPIS